MSRNDGKRACKASKKLAIGYSPMELEPDSGLEPYSPLLNDLRWDLSLEATQGCSPALSLFHFRTRVNALVITSLKRGVVRVGESGLEAPNPGLEALGQEVTSMDRSSDVIWSFASIVVFPPKLLDLKLLPGLLVRKAEVCAGWEIARGHGRLCLVLSPAQPEFRRAEKPDAF